MPGCLIVVVGYPCVGKTKFANTLSSYLRSVYPDSILSIVNEETMNISHGYENSAAEKKTRGTIKSAVHHLLNDNSIVIVDSTSTYIKGFRYELFCIAKTVRTSYCVCWIDVDISSSIQWNSERCKSSEIRYETHL